LAVYLPRRSRFYAQSSGTAGQAPQPGPISSGRLRLAASCPDKRQRIRSPEAVGTER